MILLALCCAATLFGIIMVAQRHPLYAVRTALVIVQCCALVLGVVLYLLVSMVDLYEAS